MNQNVMSAATLLAAMALSGMLGYVAANRDVGRWQVVGNENGGYLLDTATGDLWAHVSQNPAYVKTPTPWHLNGRYEPIERKPLP